MPSIRNHLTLGATWLAEQDIPKGTHRMRVWAVDDVTAEPPAMAAVWFRLTGPDGSAAPVLIAAGSAWEEAFAGTSWDTEDWTYSVLSPSGTPDGVVELA